MHTGHIVCNALLDRFSVLAYIARTHTHTFASSLFLFVVRCRFRLNISQLSAVAESPHSSNIASFFSLKIPFYLVFSLFSHIRPIPPIDYRLCSQNINIQFTAASAQYILIARKFHRICIGCAMQQTESAEIRLGWPC